MHIKFKISLISLNKITVFLKKAFIYQFSKKYVACKKRLFAYFKSKLWTISPIYLIGITGLSACSEKYEKYEEVLGKKWKHLTLR